ncbi:Hydrogenase nickel incorporation protein hypA [Frankia canadensis]|uniref:Hydrogenase maturation factor HypA n=1 Tax=Frankia canadensis TaxID=1836972 RepID=A0A2I2L2K2_9ACTN|nr:hydrogenase maturation nickel metallochaperone HypA [Frankia canadensis]SNQ52156.1 Hydrogenase nickel incorporation protein hypA [Frankia canadensis]SOU59446.1 Hydrogenase nickel incorporation protein hypA [Frankia canadensis]
MHELAVTQSVVDAILDRTGEAEVRVVRLVVGRLSGVVADSVRFCFDLVAEGTPLAGAVLAIDEPAGRARCRRCGAGFDTDDPLPLCACGCADIAVTGGDDLRIASVSMVPVSGGGG